MVRLLTIITIILSIVLFPPATLAVISNDAVPGDATYPIKRFLEDGIFTIASITPVTKAWFASARSDRRFQEITVLLNRGKSIKETLSELVEQTQTASTQIDRVKDSSQKKQLINKLSTSIEKYDQGLKKVSQNKQPLVLPPAPTPVSPPKQSQPQPTILPAQDQSVESPVYSSGPSQQEIEEARGRLEEIRRRMEEERIVLEEEERLRQSQTSSTPTPTAVPTPTPTAKSGSSPVPTPFSTPTQKPTPLPTHLSVPGGSGGYSKTKSFYPPGDDNNFISESPAPSPTAQPTCQTDCPIFP